MYDNVHYIFNHEGQDYTPNGAVRLDGLSGCPHVRSGEDAVALSDTAVRLCTLCAQDREVNAMIKADVYTVYVSSDFHRITTWTGELMGDIKWITEAKNWMCGSLFYFRAVDPNGGRWIGTTTGPGMYARIRRIRRREWAAEAPAYAATRPELQQGGVAP